MVSIKKNTFFFAVIALLLPLSVSAVLQNTTVDDSDQARIKYWTDADWSHDPLQGYEQFFVNGTRSYTYVPGAVAFFTFTGTGIYLQGPYANDQAQRSVTLDDQDMGTFSAYAPDRLPCQSSSAVFWGKGGLENTAHTVSVMHADTADKILAMDAWIFEADLPLLQSTSTAGAVVSTPSLTYETSEATDSESTSMTQGSTYVYGSPIVSTVGIVAGAIAPLILLLVCNAGYCLFSRRLPGNQQRQYSFTRDKMIPSSRSTMHLSQPIHPTSAISGPPLSHWRSPTRASAHELSSSGLNAELTTAAVAVPRGGGAALPSPPSHPHRRAASGSLNLSKHPFFSPTPWRSTTSRNLHDPTSLAIKPDFAPQPIATSPLVLRRLSATMAGVIPELLDGASPRNSNVGLGRESRMSIITNLRHNSTASDVNQILGPDVERAAFPRSRSSDAYAPSPSLPHLPSRSNSLSNLLTSSSTASIGFGRQSANLEKIDTPATPASDVDEDGDRKSEDDMYDDEYALSSYTRLKRDGIRWGPVSTVGGGNPR